MKSIAFFLSMLLILTVHSIRESVESKVYSFTETPAEKNNQGETRLILKGETTHLKNFEISAITLNPHTLSESGNKNPDFEGFVFMKEGNIKITLNGIEREIGPGSIALFMPGENLAIENNGTVPATYFLVQYVSKSPVNLTRGENAGGSVIFDWEKLAFQPHDRGGQRKFFDRQSAMSERIEMHATTLNPAIKSHEPHTHEPAEIVIMMSGTTEMEIGSKIYPGTPGDIYFLGSNIPHVIRNTGSSPCSYLAFQWE